MGAAPFVLVASVDEPALDGPAAHHLRRVRRLRPGDAVLAGDGRGGVVSCRLGADGVLEAVGEPTWVPAPQPT